MPSLIFYILLFSSRTSISSFFIVSISLMRLHFFFIHRAMIFFFFFSFIFISWRLITLQYCSGSCHTLTGISHGFTCIPHPDPPFHLPLDPIPLALPSAPGLYFTEHK